MRTWMTRSSFLATAADMDNNLLVHSAIESNRLLHAAVYDEQPAEWRFDFHRLPTLHMWEGFEVALAAYSAALCVELATRGIQVNVHMEAATTIRELRRWEDGTFVFPSWLKDTDVLRSHRSNMARRWPALYADAWKGTPENWPYLYPFVSEDGSYQLMLSKQDKELLAKGERTLPKPIQLKVANL